MAQPHSRIGRRFAGAIATSALIGGIAFVASPAAAADLIPVPKTDYQLFGVSSQSPAWPAPPALDGTALGAWDGKYDTQWASAYGQGAKAPHWLVVDQQRAISVKAIDYYMRVSQSALYAQDVAIYVTNDAETAAKAPTAENLDAWGAPAVVTRLANPTSDSKAQRITLPQAVTGRYVMIQVRTTSGVGAAAGEIEIFSDQAIPPIVPDQGTTPDYETQHISRGGVEANVGIAYPQIAGYVKDGIAFGGDITKSDKWQVNGAVYAGTTTSVASADHVDYVTTLQGIDVTIKSRISITDKGNVEFEVTELGGSTVVNTIGLPNTVFLSTTSAREGSVLSTTWVDPSQERPSADTHTPITADTAAGKRTASHAFLTNGPLVGSLITNSTNMGTGDQQDASWSKRIEASVTNAAGKTATIAPTSWVVHPAGATDERVTTFAMPKVTVMLSADRNGDGKVDWQDGAISYRETEAPRLGANRVPERVVSRIPFNFGSAAQNPFDVTLANTQRIANQTDGLGQWVLNKGYGNEGHDSANSDYGGNYNERAGGLADLNKLVEAGKALNADMSVHVNTTEYYPQAHAFNPRFLSGTTDETKKPYGPGWNWLDQSFYVDQTKELGAGDVLTRFQQLRDEVPGLSGVYIDVYYGSGWAAEGLAKELAAMKLEVASEWSDKFFGNSLWAHWANDVNYGGKYSKGLNSSMIRFISNGDADLWTEDPLLGAAQVADAEGWVGNQNWDMFMTNTWENSLPAKFLQHFDMLTYKAGEKATFTGDVTSSINNGERTITLGGAKVLQGSSYLLPWQTLASNAEAGSPLKADKMYFYTKTGGTHEFDLTAAFAGHSQFKVYRLTDQGRVEVGSATANGSKLSLTGDAGVAYVVTPSDARATTPVKYVSGPVVDMGFNAGNLDAWSPSGDVKLSRTSEGSAKDKKVSVGDNIAVFGQAASSISQKVKGLQPGKRYSFSAQIEIGQAEDRAVTVSAAGKTTESNTFSNTPLYNTDAGDAKAGTNFQRARVSTVANDAGEITISVSAVAGGAAVRIDALRVMADTSSPQVAGTIASEDFESNLPGWGPFVKGAAGGKTDPRTSISHRNDPYTSKEWRNTAYPYAPKAPSPGQAVDTTLNGNHSLYSHSENTGLVYRTVPATVNFQAGHKYRVSMNYQASHSGAYEFQVGSDLRANGMLSAQVLEKLPIVAAHTTTPFTKEFIAGCGDGSWVGVNRIGGPDGELIVDDVAIVDLGAVENLGCATIDVSKGSFNPGAATEWVTTLTNVEADKVTNVAQQLTLPAGWSAQVKDGSSNLKDALAIGESFSTTWLVTAPAEAKGTSATIKVEGTYLAADCVARTASNNASVSVVSRSVIPGTSIKATASSEETGSGAAEGPAANMLDGDPSTIWHSRWSSNASNFPYELVFDLGATSTVDGIGYLRRGANTNGPIKDYRVETSVDGQTYTSVASGAWQNVAGVQDVNFAAVQARYVKVTALSSISGTQFAAIAEMTFYGKPAVATGHAPKERPTDAACGAAKVELSAATVAAGGKVDATLSGFANAADLTLWIGADRVGTVKTDAAGKATVSVTVPAATAPGAAAIIVKDAAGAEKARANLTVTQRQIPVTATATPRCYGGMGTIAVTVLNRDTAPVDITIVNGTQSKTLKNVAPGKYGSAAFVTPTKSTPAGVATVTVKQGTAPATEVVAPYAALNCS